MLGVLLVTGLAPALAAIGAIALFTVFAVALGVSLARANTAPCHCFGASEVEKISPLALVRALALDGAAIAVLIFALGGTGSITRDELTASLLMAAGLVAIAAGAAAGWWVTTYVMEADWRFAPASAVLIVAGGALASLLAGLAFALRPLAARPARVLRARE